MSTLQNRKPKGITGMAVFDKSTTPKTAYPVDTPGTATLDPGIEEILSETRSQLGELVVESSIIDAVRPVISCTFPGMTPTLLALRLGKKLEEITGTGTSVVEKRFRVTESNKVYTGATSGQEGFGMDADQALSYAWVLDGLGIPKALTRVAFASFNAATDDTFAQGVNGAYKIADNIVGSDVQTSFPFGDLDTLEIGEGDLSDLEVNITVIMKDLRLWRIEIPSVSIDFGGSGEIPLGPGEVNVNFRVTYSGETCQPIKYKFLDQLRAC